MATRTTYKGSISISRPHGPEPPYIEISIVDDLSGSQFVEARIPLKEFAELITGLSHVDCEFDFRPDLVGKKREHKEEVVPFKGFHIQSEAKGKQAAAKALALWTAPLSHRVPRSYVPLRKSRAIRKHPRVAPLHGLRAIESLEERFRKQADKWRRETEHVSSPSQMMMHPSYIAILGMAHGHEEEMIRLMLRDLRDNRTPWFWALSYLTHDNPIQDSEAGRLDKMIKAWVDWGKARDKF